MTFGPAMPVADRAAVRLVRCGRTVRGESGPVRRTVPGTPAASGPRGARCGDREDQRAARQARRAADPVPVRPGTPRRAHRPPHRRGVPAPRHAGAAAARGRHPRLPQAERAAQPAERRHGQLRLRASGVALRAARRPHRQDAHRRRVGGHRARRDEPDRPRPLRGGRRGGPLDRGPPRPRSHPPGGHARPPGRHQAEHLE